MLTKMLNNFIPTVYQPSLPSIFTDFWTIFKNLELYIVYTMCIHKTYQANLGHKIVSIYVNSPALTDGTYPQKNVV